MADIVWITVLGQLALPAVLVLDLACTRSVGRLEWALKLLSLAAYMGMIAVVGIWVLIPGWALWGYLAAAGAAGWSARRLRVRLDPAPTRLRRLAAQAALGAVCLAVAATALVGYAPPGPEPVALASPLRDGVFYAVNGGYSILINPHMKALRRPELAAYRGQSYAVDLVKLDGWGRRASGLLPVEPEDYLIFGQPVVAPCAGKVARTEDSLPDRDPAELESRPPAGNFVLLDCGAHQVLLAHLMEGSVRVGKGERVQAGQPIGRVGNSGRSTEPHLHLHAQGLSATAGFDTNPLPIRVDGRILVRGSRLDTREGGR